MTLFSYKVLSMRALSRSLLFPGRLSKQYSTDTSDSGSIYLKPEKYNLSLILHFICQKCYPTHQNTMVTVLQSLSSMVILGPTDMKLTPHCHAKKASGLTIVLAEQNYYWGIRNFETLSSLVIPPPPPNVVEKPRGLHLLVLKCQG